MVNVHPPWGRFTPEDPLGLRGASNLHRFAKQSGSKVLDWFSQAEGYSYMHSMKQDKQTDDDAEDRRDRYIKGELQQAAAEERAGNHRSAMAHLSHAMHTTMDATSPLHVDRSGNPRVWRIGDFRSHARAEDKVNPTEATYRDQAAVLGGMYRQSSWRGQELQVVKPLTGGSPPPQLTGVSCE